MTITLNPEQERVINDEIKSGRFRTPDEVVDHALAALHRLADSGAAVDPRRETSPGEIDRILDDLAAGGENVQPLAATFSREDIYFDHD